MIYEVKEREEKSGASSVFTGRMIIISFGTAVTQIHYISSMTVMTNDFLPLLNLTL